MDFPRERDLVVVEPPVSCPESPPVKRGLVYRVRISGRQVVPDPASSTDDDDGDSPRRRQRRRGPDGSPSASPPSPPSNGGHAPTVHCSAFDRVVDADSGDGHAAVAVEAVVPTSASSVVSGCVPGIAASPAEVSLAPDCVEPTDSGDGPVAVAVEAVEPVSIRSAAPSTPLPTPAIRLPPANCTEMGSAESSVSGAVRVDAAVEADEFPATSCNVPGRPCGDWPVMQLAPRFEASPAAPTSLAPKTGRSLTREKQAFDDTPHPSTLISLETPTRNSPVNAPAKLPDDQLAPAPEVGSTAGTEGRHELQLVYSRQRLAFQGDRMTACTEECNTFISQITKSTDAVIVAPSINKRRKKTLPQTSHLVGAEELPRLESRNHPSLSTTRRRRSYGP